jgi:hypothetical protein
VALENDKRARLVKEASAFSSSVPRQGSGYDQEANHKRVELQIEKLKEDGARVWHHLQGLPYGTWK